MSEIRPEPSKPNRPYAKRFLTAMCVAVFSAWMICSVAGATAALPLQAARTIKFQTDEGTWLSLAVAPNGKTIFFELLGDIYALDVLGGQARGLLGGLPFETQPAVSPDGKRIAFVSDRSGNENLWIANADGSQLRQLSKEDEGAEFVSPAWSTDGKYVYVSRSEPRLGVYSTWVYYVDGGRGFRLDSAARESGISWYFAAAHDHSQRAAGGDNAGVNALGPTPSPDGRYLYFSASDSGFEMNASLPLWRIARHDLTTGQQDTIITATGSAMKPVLSPDGKYLVYATRFDGETGLRLRNLESGDDRWLAYPVQRDAQEEIPSRDLMPAYAFTPDGKAIIVGFGGKIRRVDVATGATTVIPFVADVSLDVGPRLEATQKIPTGPVRARLIQSPRQSPDGKRLVFSAIGSLYTMDLASGAAPRRLTSSSEPEFQPSWSPDGRSIAYITWSPKGGQVLKISADGGRPQALTGDGAYYTEPLFAADSKTVYALRSSNYARMFTQEDSAGRIADLVRLTAADRAPAVVVHAPGARGLHLGSDPQRVFYYSEGGVRSVRLDGSDRRVQVRIKGPGAQTSSESVLVGNAKLSPDGKWALAQLISQVYLLAVPQTGAADFTVDLANPSVPSRRLTVFGADDFAWADAGKTITWSLGATFYRTALADVAFDAANDVASEEFAVRVEVPRDIPRGTIVLRGATLISMKGDEIIEDSDVAIVDNRIVGVGRRGTIEVPPGAQIRDVAGKFVIPGFIDTHAHWYEERHGVLDVDNWIFSMNLAYGVTAGLDVQTFTSEMFAYEDMIDAGRMTGLRAFSTGAGMFSISRIRSLQDALALQRRYRDFYGTRNLKSYKIGNRRQRQLTVAAAHELGMIPTTEGGMDFKLDITHAIDGFHGNEHGLPTVPLYKDIIELFSRTRIGYSVVGMVAYGGPFGEDHFFIHQSPHRDPKVNRFMPHFINDARTRRRTWFREEDQIFPRVAAEAAKIMRAGGRIGVGSHSQIQGLAFHWEMQVLASGGLQPHEILQAATRHGSEIIGRSGEIGSIEPGKLADLLILEKNPLDDIRNSLTIEHVMKNGRLYRGDTLDEVWPRQRTKAPAWFSTDAPVSKAATGS